MWAELSARGMPPPAATESEWQDLFAYFYSLQFFEPPAEVGRGKRVLESKRCTDCHSLTKTPTARGPSVADWAHMDDPVVLVYQLWNHASTMKNTFARNKIAWKTLTGRDLRDLTAYIQNVQTLVPNEEFSLPAPESGKPLFEANCGICHRDYNSLAMKLRNKTWMDIGADIWNHAQKMPTVRMVGPDDMRKILAYVWQLQYDGPPGSPVLGQKAFVEKRCVECHQGPIFRKASRQAHHVFFHRGGSVGSGTASPSPDAGSGNSLAQPFASRRFQSGRLPECARFGSLSWVKWLNDAHRVE